MPELRVALVMVPPLLADLITATVAARLARAGVRLSTFTVPAIVTHPAAPPGSTAADAAILGPGDAARAIARTLFAPAMPMLRLSANLTRLLGPRPGDSAPFTPEVLAERLRDITPKV
jgi:hypothetical protein